MRLYNPLSEKMHFKYCRPIVQCRCRQGLKCIGPFRGMDYGRGLNEPTYQNTCSELTITEGRVYAVSGVTIILGAPANIRYGP